MKGFTKMPVRKSKSEARKSAEWWRERGHKARVTKASKGKYSVHVKEV